MTPHKENPSKIVFGWEGYDNRATYIKVVMCRRHMAGAVCAYIAWGRAQPNPTCQLDCEYVARIYDYYPDGVFVSANPTEKMFEGLDEAKLWVDEFITGLGYRILDDKYKVLI